MFPTAHGIVSQGGTGEPPAPGGGYLYYRLLVTANNGDAYLGIAEVSLYDSPGGASKSTNAGTVTASSDDGTNPPANAFDGDTNTSWRSASAPAYPQWVQKAFTAPLTIVYYAVTNWNGAASPTERSPQAWELQGSNNGSDWTTIDTQSGHTSWTQAQRRAFQIAGANMPRYRLLVSANNGDTHLGISEIELYASIGGAAVPVANLELSSASAQLANDPPTYAFDGNTSTSWRVEFGSGPHWVEGIFPDDLVVAQYGVRNWHTSVSAAARAPRDWKLQKSTDGVTWTDLHTVSGETGWTQGELRKFTL